MKTRTAIILMGILAALTWNGYAVAADSNNPPPPPQMGPGGPGGPDGIIGVIMHRLNLTDTQREKIETILDASRDKMETAREAVDKAHKALQDAIAADANETAIRSAAAALGTAIGDEAVLKAATMKEIKAVLTADQLKKLADIQAKMKERGARPMRQGRGGPGPGHISPPPDEE
jgi:Spy/CpxP family protein refolding chaperone